MTFDDVTVAGEQWGGWLGGNSRNVSKAAPPAASFIFYSVKKILHLSIKMNIWNTVTKMVMVFEVWLD